jgi:hypothetical protein
MRELNVTKYELDQGIIYNPGFIQGEFETTIGGQIVSGEF